ncbi:MAG: NnrU family protein [Alphaproteobacteria bacterium]|nr:NnrU family protein [Alphaproteobacteria bacterium]
MTQLVLAAGAFLAIHFLVAGTALRGVLVGALGERVYLALFSLASIGLFVWLVLAYGAARAAGSPLLWSAPLWAYHLVPVLMLPVILLAVAGLTTPSPTLVGGEGRLARDAAAPDHGVRGVITITRHPFLSAVALWALIHGLVNGDVAALILFATFLLLGLGGPVSIDAKRARSAGPAWEGFARTSSAVPFAAIAAGRTRLDLAGIGWGRLGLGLAVYGLLLLGGHACLVGASPMPGVLAAACPL